MSDEVAIMKEGRLRAFGSPHALKREHAVGYLLTISLADDQSPQQDAASAGATAAEAVLRAVHHVLPDALVDHRSQTEVSVLLPSEHVQQFPALFAHLEQHQAALGIGSFGISASKLEDVFLAVTADSCSQQLSMHKTSTGVGDHSDSTAAAAAATAARPPRMPAGAASARPRRLVAVEEGDVAAIADASQQLSLLGTSSAASGERPQVVARDATPSQQRSWEPAHGHSRNPSSSLEEALTGDAHDDDSDNSSDGHEREQEQEQEQKEFDHSGGGGGGGGGSANVTQSSPSSNTARAPGSWSSEDAGSDSVSTLTILWVLYRKRAQHTRRDVKAFLSMICLPVVLVCLSMLVAARTFNLAPGFESACVFKLGVLCQSTHSLTHTHTHSLSLSHTNAHSHSLSHTITYTHPHTLTHCLSFFLTCRCARDTQHACTGTERQPLQWRLLLRPGSHASV